MALNLNHLKLFNELSERAKSDDIADHLKARLVASINQINSILGEIRIYFRHFTDHSFNHSCRIIHNMGSFLTDEQVIEKYDGTEVITTMDLFMLIGVALVHDIGMVVSEKELNNLEKNELFQKFCLAHSNEFPGLEDIKSLSHGVNRLLLSEFYRKNHTKRAFELVVDDNILPKPLTDGCERIKYWLGKISEAHGLSFEEVCDIEQYPIMVDIQLPGGMICKFNPRFVAICLRLGDLLDIGTARACPILRNVSEPLSLLSKSHWDQYQDIEIRNFAPKSEIVIFGTCPNQNAERILREWVSWIEKESAAAVSLQNLDNKKYSLNVGRIKYNVKPRLINGKPAYEFLEFRFNLDEKLVFERLFGKALYGRNELAIREIIQNAIDAQRTKIAIDCNSKVKDWSCLNNEERIFIYNKELKEQANDLPIIINYRNEMNDSGDQTYWLDIKDSGIGMSRETIENYLLKVGRSRWGHDPIISELGIGNLQIGQFGIGIISALMISDQIIITTKSIDSEQKGLKATIYGWKGYLATEPLELSKNGTSISLRLFDKWFVDLKDLSRIICELIPIPDFPIITQSSDCVIQIPNISLIDNNKDICVLDYDSEGSKIILRLNKSSTEKQIWEGDQSIVNDLLISNKQIVLIQDGILIGEVSLPQGEDVESLLLNKYNVMLSLKGDSRIALDLSRNTVEGGQQALWHKLVPKIWNIISDYFGINYIATYMIRRLVEERFKWDIESPILLIKKSNPLYKGLESLSNVETISFIESAISLKFKINSDFPSFVLPREEIDELIPFTQSTDDAIDYSDFDPEANLYKKYYSKKKSYYYISNHQFVDPEKDQFIRLKKKVTVLDKEWDKILGEFKYVSIAEKGNLILSKINNSYGQLIYDLIGFRISENRIHLIEPWKSRPTLVPIEFDYEQFTEIAKSLKLSIADLYLFLIYNVFSTMDDKWQGLSGKYSKEFESFGLEISKRIYKYLKSLTNTKSKWVESEDEDEGEYETLKDEDNIFLSNLKKFGFLFKDIAVHSNLEKAVCSWEKF